MTNKQIKAFILASELQGNKVESLQLGNDVFIYVNGDLELTCEVK